MSTTDVQQVSLDLLSEFAVVTEYADSAIEKAMTDGFEHGYRGNWKGQSAAVHVGHAFRHIEKALGAGLDSTAAVTDLAHALCRLAMAFVQWPSD